MSNVVILDLANASLELGSDGVHLSKRGYMRACELMADSVKKWGLVLYHLRSLIKLYCCWEFDKLELLCIPQIPQTHTTNQEKSQYDIFVRKWGVFSPLPGWRSKSTLVRLVWMCVVCLLCVSLILSILLFFMSKKPLSTHVRVPKSEIQISSIFFSTSRLRRWKGMDRD